MADPAVCADQRHTRRMNPAQPRAVNNSMRDQRHQPAGWWHALTRTPLTPRAERLARIAVNLAGAALAASFAQASLLFYAHTHRLLRGLFAIEPTWFAIAFLVRQPPRAWTGPASPSRARPGAGRGPSATGSGAGWSPSAEPSAACCCGLAAFT